LKYLLKSACLLVIVSVGFTEPSRFFRQETFDSYIYPESHSDSSHRKYLLKKLKKRFPDARSIQVQSHVTHDDPNKVVLYYTRLSGQRFYKKENGFLYVFREIEGEPTSHIAISKLPIPFIKPNQWPTRIDMVLVNFPISFNADQELSRTWEDFENKVGRLAYKGELREDLATIEMSSIETPAEIFIIATKDPFYNVQSFFRRRLGRLWVIPARDGDLFVRDFEVDATRALGLDRDEVECHIRAEENPIFTDQQGNSQTYLGFTFIKYIFWHNEPQ
jgi:hypothetical protein